MNAIQIRISELKEAGEFNTFRLGGREKINLIFYFYTSLWCLKMFYEGLNCLHKTF